MTSQTLLRSSLSALFLAGAALPAPAQHLPLLRRIPPPAKVPFRRASARIAGADVALSVREQEQGILNLRMAEPLLRTHYYTVTKKSPEAASSYLQWLFDWRYADRGQFPNGVKGIVLHWTAGRHVFGALDALKGRNNSVHFIVTEELPLGNGRSDCLVIKLMDLTHIPRAAAFPDIMTFSQNGRTYEKYDGAYIDIEITANGYEDIIARPKQYRRVLQLVDYLVDYLGAWPTIDSADANDPRDFNRITQVLTGHGVIAEEYVAAMLKIKRPDLADYPRTDWVPWQLKRFVADLQAYRRNKDVQEEGAQDPWELSNTRQGDPPPVVIPNVTPLPPAD